MSSLIGAMPAAGVGPPPIAVAEVRFAPGESSLVADVACATAVSCAPIIESLWPSLDRTIIRCGVSAAGLPGELPLDGLPPEPVDIAWLSKMLGGSVTRVKHPRHRGLSQRPLTSLFFSYCQ